MRYEFPERKLMIEVDECRDITPPPIDWNPSVDGKTWSRVHSFRGVQDYTVHVSRSSRGLTIDAPGLVLVKTRNNVEGLRSVRLGPESKSTV